MLNMLDKVLPLVKKAGDKILEIYQSDEFGIESKADHSPLTRADTEAHNVLAKGLLALDVGPVLSEEDADIAWSERQTWSQYWLIDPLDGTKEFIKRNGEFTVNVALIVDGEPVLGVVYAPVMKLWYIGEKGKGAFKRIDNGKFEPIFPSSIPAVDDLWRVVGSRSHSSPDFDDFMAALPNAELVSMGSSLKLCMVAEGKADLYPRLIPTCEWDTAAAQAVVEAAGGVVLNWDDKKQLRYNTKDSLLNSYFIVCSNRSALDFLPNK